MINELGQNKSLAQMLEDTIKNYIDTNMQHVLTEDDVRHIVESEFDGLFESKICDVTFNTTVEN
tara:strand:- start:168 stop:359 length:192 start_codon:yes stop_codon:yes gene_type:complete